MLNSPTLRNVAIFAFLGVAALGFYLSLPESGRFVDLGGFIESGRAVRAGLDPYAAYPMTPRAIVAGQIVSWPNANPPVSLPLDAALSLLDLKTAKRIWWIVSLAAYLAAVFLLVREHPRSDRLLFVAWSLAITPFWLTLRGQIYTVLALIVVATWILLKRDRYLLAALPLGVLVASKPNFVLWLLSLLLVGEITLAAVSLAVAVVLSTLPLALYGPTVYREWVHALVAYPYAPWAYGQSVFSIGLSLGHPEWGYTVGLVLAALLFVCWPIWLRRIRCDVLRVSEGALILTLLITPVSWDGYLLVLLPVFIWRPLRWPAIGAAILMVVGVAAIGVHWPIAALVLVDHALDSLGQRARTNLDSTPSLMPPTSVPAV